MARLPQEFSAVSADVQVQHGRIKTVQLAEHITTGRQQWLQWHADFAENLPALIQVSRGTSHPVLQRTAHWTGPPSSAELSLICSNQHWAVNLEHAGLYDRIDKAYIIL